MSDINGVDRMTKHGAGHCISSRHADRAGKVVEIIRQDFAVWYSLEALAKMVGLSELELQTVFKSVHGTTVALFAREARLGYAHEQLQKTDAPLRVFCEMVGYPDPSNFCCAFLKQFGYRPGAVRSNMIT